MSAVVESYASAINEGTSATQIVVDAPTGIVAGNLLVASFRHRGASTVPPSGWTEQSFIDDPNDNKHSLMTKVADSSDETATDYTFAKSGGGNGLLAVGVARVSGQDDTAPLNVIEALPEASQPETSNQSTAPDATTTVDDCLVLRLWGGSPSGSGSDRFLVAPVGVTETWRLISTNVNRNILTGGYEVQVSAGSVGTSTAIAGDSGTYRPNAFTVGIASAGEADFDPANLAATVDGDTVSLSWDASPLVTA